MSSKLHLACCELVTFQNLKGINRTVYTWENIFWLLLYRKLIAFEIDDEKKSSVVNANSWIFVIPFDWDTKKLWQQLQKNCQ